MKKFLFLMTMLASMSAFATEATNVCWSHYTGWEPWAYAEKAGYIKEANEKFGVNIQLKLINTYMASIEQYTLNPKPVKNDPCTALTITNMDALTAPALAGVDTEVIIVGDFSNGNDAIISHDPAITTPADLKGKKIAGVQFSVSHYLLSRALKINKLTERDVKFVNTDEAEIPNYMRAGKTNTVKPLSVTWNPWKQTILNEGGKSIFDSSKIPGEIVDTLVVKTGTPVAVKKALTFAWYKTMKAMSSTPAGTNPAVKYMAEFAGGTLPDFLSQLKTTEMFYEPSKAVTFTNSKSLKNTMNYIRTFSHKVGIYQGKSADFVGIQFPDGTIEGDKSNVKLRFTSTYMQLASEGKL
ncbi:putative urea ABC transporter substrate-binding protein [bacterium]|nr:putative urea ABC transporter substrate-binding protein [bacterium]